MTSAPAPDWNIVTRCNSTEGSDFVGDILPNFSTANELLFSTGNYAVPYVSISQNFLDKTSVVTVWYLQFHLCLSPYL